MKKIVLFLACAVLSVTACNSPELTGKWNVTKIGGEAVECVVGAPFISFDAEQNRIHGNTGVNIINGSYRLDGKKVSFDGLTTTMMAGPEQDMQVERKYLSAINSTVSAKAAGKNKIILVDEAGKAVMELVKE